MIRISSDTLVCLCRHCRCVLSRHRVMQLPKKRTRRRTDMSTSCHVSSDDLPELVWTSGGFMHIYHCKHLADIILWFQVRAVLTAHRGCILYCVLRLGHASCFMFIMVSLSDDHSRVHLSSLEGVPDSDFINASFINVSRSRNFFFYP